MIFFHKIVQCKKKGELYLLGKCLKELKILRGSIWLIFDSSGQNQIL